VAGNRNILSNSANTRKYALRNHDSNVVQSKLRSEFMSLLEE